MESKYRGMLLELEPAERLRMGCRMFQTAKSFLIAGIREKLEGDVDQDILRREIFLRLYGREFFDAQLTVILAYLGRRNTE
jgi:hypothetical protein